MRLVERARNEVPEDTSGIEVPLAMFLRHCRAHVSALRTALMGTAARQHRASLAGALNALFEELDDAALFAEDVLLLQTEIAARAVAAEALFGSEAGDVVVARAFADAIDRVLGPRLVDRFRRRGTYRLAAGDPFPVPAPDLRAIFGHDLGTRPESRGALLDETLNLRILSPPERGLRVALSTDRADALGSLSAGRDVAVAWTTRLAALDWEAERRGDDWCFFNVRPKDEAARVADAIRALECALIETPAAVVVLPELSLGPAGVEKLLDWSKSHRHPFALLVPGSVHTVVEPDRRVNIAPMQFADGACSEHRKFNPFVLQLPAKDTGERVAHTEAISNDEPTVTLHLAGLWSVVVLICKDFLEPGVTALLSDLRARLVVVPARSPRTTDFEVEAAAHAARVQGLVVVANEADPDRPMPAAALVARPVRTRIVETLEVDALPTPPMHRFSVHRPA